MESEMETIGQKGMWVLACEKLPTMGRIKFTLTEAGHLGLAVFSDDEWVQLLPTYLGEVYKWYMLVDSGGNEVGLDINSPELMV